jgi:2-methylcitrate dehydratase PrpD
LTAGLGQAWRGDEVSFKPYPCGRPLHAALDAAIAVHDALGLSPDAAIEAATVTADPHLIGVYFNGSPAKRRPTQIVEAQFAFPFLVATALLHGRVGIDEVARFDDPRVIALSDCILGAPAAGPTGVSVRLADGRAAARSVAIALGAPENPLSDARRAAKFRDCAGHAVRAIAPAALERVLTALDGLEREADARAIVQALS